MKKFLLLLFLATASVAYSQKQETTQSNPVKLEGSTYVIPSFSSSTLASNSRYNCEVYMFFQSDKEGFISRLVSGKWTKDKFTYTINGRQIEIVKDGHSYPGEIISDIAIYIDGLQRCLWIKLE